MTLLDVFLDAAPSGTARTLAALACAESLTDTVALAIYEQAPAPGLAATDFVSAFKYSGLTEPRNSEWSLAPSIRRELLESPALDAQARQTIHQLLLSFGLDEANRLKAGAELPSYLFTNGGQAYHFAGAGKLSDALGLYSEASKGRLTGAQWLGAKLAEEQERLGVLPKGRVETTFLRALVLWREGQRQAAIPLFRQVAATDLVMREVAIALHILGNDNRQGQRKEAEAELRRSIDINEALSNRLGMAQALHTLGNLFTRQDRFEEAEEAYRRSILIDGEFDNMLGVAQTTHSLANMLFRQKRLKEAELAYLKSIEIGEELPNRFHVASTLHSLANLFTRQNRFPEAEALYHRSIATFEDLGNQSAADQTRHSLGNLLAHQKRFEEAEAAYRLSIVNSDDRFHLAQTLHSLGNLLARQERLDEAEDVYQQSIKMGQRLRNENHLAQVLRSYGLAVGVRAPDRAMRLLEQSRDINQRRGNKRFVALVERDLRRFRGRTQS